MMMIRKMALGALAGVLALASSVLACDQCVLREALRQQQAQQRMAQVQQMYGSGGMFGPEWAEWVTNSDRQRYQPARYVPRGFEALERQRIVNDQLFGPGGYFNAHSILNRIGY